MASIHKAPNGTRRILFVASDGVRRCVRLGKLSARLADNYKGRIETILAYPPRWHARMVKPQTGF